MYKIFLRIWDFALQDKERCSFFIRYYYSRYYKKECNIERERIYQNVITLLGKALKDPSNATWLFNFILDVFFSVSVKVLREEIPDNNQTRQSMFLLIYTCRIRCF